MKEISTPVDIGWLIELMRRAGNGRGIRKNVASVSKSERPALLHMSTMNSHNARMESLTRRHGGDTATVAGRRVNSHSTVVYVHQFVV